VLVYVGVQEFYYVISYCKGDLNSWYKGVKVCLEFIKLGAGAWPYTEYIIQKSAVEGGVYMESVCSLVVE